MAIDLAKVKSRLEAMKSSSGKTGFWKPQGKSTIRIIPYLPHQPDNPFLELHIHYNLNGKTVISPSTFNRPDPIVEFAKKLQKESNGDKAIWKQGRSLEPKLRVYVPILVRGEEDQGVKFWGMGKQVYEELLGIIADPEYGDITDIKTGRDITVENKPAASKDAFPTTIIRTKPNPTPAFNPADKVLFEKVKNQKNVLELFPEPTYEELSAAMDILLNGNSSEEALPEVPAEETTSEVVDDATTSEVVSTPTKVSVTSTPKSVTQQKAGIKAPASTQAIASEFDQLFNT